MAGKGNLLSILRPPRLVSVSILAHRLKSPAAFMSRQAPPPNHRYGLRSRGQHTTPSPPPQLLPTNVNRNIPSCSMSRSLPILYQNNACSRSEIPMSINTERTNLHDVDNPEEMFGGTLSSPTRVYCNNLHVLAMMTSRSGLLVSSHSQLEHAGSLADNDGT